MTDQERRRTYALLILTTVIWGIQPLCIKWLVTAWSPVTITAMRYFIIGPVLILIACSRGEHWLPPKSLWIPLIGMGVTGIGFNNVMQFTGLQYSTVTNCTLIAAASPAITAFFAAILIRERLSLLSWFGILISFIGALLVVSHGSWEVVSHLAIVVSLYGLVTNDFHPVNMEPALWGAYAYAVIFGGIMAMLFWNIGVKHAGPSLTSIFQNITPVVGMIGGVLMFNEVVGALQLIGAASIFIGVYLTTHSS